VPNLQEAFFKQDKFAGVGSPISDDSVDGAKFDMLRSDSLIESFG